MKNLRNVTLLVMVTSSLVIAYGMTKTGKLFGVRTWFSTKLSCTKIASSSEAKKPEVILLKDIPEYEVGESSGTKDQETKAPEEIQTTHIIELRRSSRIPRPPQRHCPALHYILLTNRGEPESHDEAVEDKESVKWELAMKDEMDSLLSNQTWKLAELPKGKKTLYNKWVYRIKEEYDGNKWYKARLVVKGSQ